MALSKAQLSKLNKEDLVTYALGLQDKLIDRISALDIMPTTVVYGRV